MTVPTQALKIWLKSNPNIRLGSDAAVTRIASEGITTFASLLDFDEKSIHYLSGTCKQSIPAIQADDLNNSEAEPSVNGENISTISVCCLIVAVNDAKFYDAAGRIMTPQSMHYRNFLSDFKVEWDAYEDLRTKDYPNLPKVNDKDQDRKIIRWYPIFLDWISSTYGSRSSLHYVLCDNTEVPGEYYDPLLMNTYYGQSGSLLEEFIKRLPHEGPIFKNDNATVYMMIEKSFLGYSVESTIKSYSRKKD